MKTWTESFARLNLLPLVVSYFTDGFYEREAFELLRSCQQFELDYLISEVPNLKSWEKNASFKPSFLKGIHAEYPHRDILWVDADARFRQFPSLFVNDLVAPVGYHLWRGKTPASGTVYLRRGEGRGEILERWIQECIKSPHTSDQPPLQKVAARLESIILLPVEYCWIYDVNPMTMKKGTQPTSRPVIEHMQASRWVKKGITHEQEGSLRSSEDEA